MRKLRRIFSMAMVFILCISVLPMNENLLKAEETPDESEETFKITARIFDGEKWEDAKFDYDFNESKVRYEMNIDKKYTKIQFFINGSNSITKIIFKISVAGSEDVYKIEDYHSESLTIPAGTSRFKFLVEPYSSKHSNDTYNFKINRTSSDGSEIRNVYLKGLYIYNRTIPAYAGDLIKIKSNSRSSGQIFDKWLVENNNFDLKYPGMNINEFIMPNEDIVIRSTYKDGVLNDSRLRNIYVYALKDNIWEIFCVPIDNDSAKHVYEVNLENEYDKVYLIMQEGNFKLDDYSEDKVNKHFNVKLNNDQVGMVKDLDYYRTEKINLPEGENTFDIKVISNDESSTSEYTLKINYGEVKYKVSLVPGEGKGEAIEKEYAKGSKYTLPECTFEAPANKEFKAWSVDSKEKAVGDVITINEDTEITANWQDKPIETLKVTLVANNNIDDNIETEIEKGTEYVLPTCDFTAPEGQVFKAWEIDNKEYKPQESIKIDEATIIKAIWQDKSNPDKPNPDKPNQKHAINISPSPYGEVIIDPREAKAGDKVSVHAIAKYGYELVGLSVRDASGKLLPITNGQFIMPDGEVDIYPIFREIAPYIEPETDKKAEREEQKRRHRGNYYHEEENNEDEAKTIDKVQEEKQKESKVLISIGDKKLDKINNCVHTVLNMDVKPYIKGGRTMLPLRYVAEALGYRVAWLSETRTAVIMDIGLRVEIPVDSNFIIVNGVKYTSDVKPELRKNRIMLPIANIARALGFKDGKDIIWDEVNRQVTLIRNFNTK